LKIRVDRGARGLDNTGTRYRLVIGMTDSRLGILIVHFTWFSSLTGAGIAGRALKAKERGEQSYPLILLVPRIRLKGGCIEMHHTPNLQHPLLPSLPSCRLQEEWSEVEGERKRKVEEAYYRARTAELLSLGYSL
jgi:hypothetical protein